MNILFLDVDGVLNCEDYLRKTANGGIVGIDPFRVALLHRILEATGAKVVVSSSWRLHDESLEDVKKAVDPHYLARTPHLWERDRRVDRGEEIAKWLADHQYVKCLDPKCCAKPLPANYLGHKIGRYAILDDESDAGLGHEGNFFKTAWYGDGLNEIIVEKVITHLNAE